jgi:hypothetical protein
MFGDVFDGDRIFNVQSMRLTLDSRLVNQYPSISSQSCIPGNMLVFDRREGDRRLNKTDQQRRYRRGHQGRQPFGLSWDLAAVKLISFPLPIPQRLFLSLQPVMMGRQTMRISFGGERKRTSLNHLRHKFPFERLPWHSRPG